MTEQASKTPSALALGVLMDQAQKSAGADCSGTTMFGRHSICFTNVGLHKFVSEQLATVQAQYDALIVVHGETRKQLEAAQELRAFAEKVSRQKPEKPDYWSSCGQCEHNISDAEDLIDAASAAQAEKTEKGGSK